MQNVRRRVYKDLTSRNKHLLKSNKNLLNKRNESLSNKELILLRKLLDLSSDLEMVYNIKKKLIDWYDYSLNYNQAVVIFDRWLLCCKVTSEFI
ncbi:transposase [Romboutsia sp.]|uniref:transposase n=1 Tax=Romboutsia sp. TaxID=1965302 RepID=UPI003F3644E4